MIVEAAGTIDAVARHAWTALDEEKHVVNVSAEADALLGLASQKKALFIFMATAMSRRSYANKLIRPKPQGLKYSA